MCMHAPVHALAVNDKLVRQFGHSSEKRKALCLSWLCQPRVGAHAVVHAAELAVPGLMPHLVAKQSCFLQGSC